MSKEEGLCVFKPTDVEWPVIEAFQKKLEGVQYRTGLRGHDLVAFLNHKSPLFPACVICGVRVTYSAAPSADEIVILSGDDVLCALGEGDDGEE